MKSINCFYLILAITIPGAFVSGFAQGMHDGGTGGYLNPDSLKRVTVSGTALVDFAAVMPVYYLDENGDGQPDYHLNFGSYWYQPDSGNAVRPMDGDAVTVTGGEYDSTMFGFPTVVVYEINGEFWRDPYEPFWTELDGHMNDGMHHQDGCNGYAFGPVSDSLTTVKLSGTALVDTTFIMEHYFLDEDGDGHPDYFLNFGPPWYESPSGATRPRDGDQISIAGGLTGDSTSAMIIVYEINGQVWRDSSQIGHYFGGGWMHSNMTDSVRIHDPFDQDDWMQVNPGWHQMMGHGGMMPDSLFGRMLQLYPENIPDSEGQHIFAGFEIGMFTGGGQNMMWQGGSCGGMMSFASNADFQLHYNDIQMQGFNIDEKTIQAKYWDDQSNSWVTVSNAVLNPESNTVRFSGSEVSNYVILTGQQVTAIRDNAGGIAVKSFTLNQNYPNPFNPATTIDFTLVANAHVQLNIYNVLGQRIATLINTRMAAGAHSIIFDGENLPSGTYFYELITGGKSQVKKMTLMK